MTHLYMLVIWSSIFLIKRWEHESLPSIEGIENNNIKLNQNKCHLLVFGYKNENFVAHLGNKKDGESNKRKLLGLDLIEI